MTTVVVSNTAGLTSALQSAQAGETIELEPGTYTPLSISNLNFSAPVTITSEVPVRSGDDSTTLTGLYLDNDHGLEFKFLNFSGVTDTSTNPNPEVFVNAFEVIQSSDLTFFESSFEGTPGVNNGLTIWNGQDVLIRSNTFGSLQTGITDSNSTGVTIVGNRLFDITGDGIDNAGATNVTLANNTFEDFTPNGSVHPDAMQFWTNSGAPSSQNIVVKNNVVKQGTGGTIQGVFIQDAPGLPFSNVSIVHNTVIGGDDNALLVEGASDVDISGNTVMGQGGNTTLASLQAAANAENFPRIVIIDIDGAVVSGNIAPGFDYETISDLTVSGNTFAKVVETPSSSASASAATTTSSGTANFISAMATIGAGASAATVTPSGVAATTATRLVSPNSHAGGTA